MSVQQSILQTRVWNFELPPYPQEGLFHSEMSEFCQMKADISKGNVSLKLLVLKPESDYKYLTLSSQSAASSY